MKAIIPIAGKGTRMLPITSVIPKALLPLVDSQGQVKAVLHVILEQVKQAGMDEVAIVVSPGQQCVVESYLQNLSPQATQYLPTIIRYIEQTVPNGFGDAVYQTKGFVGQDSFIIMLGDFIHVPNPDQISCVAQVKNAYEMQQIAAVVGMQVVTEEVLPLVGVATGIPKGDNLYQATRFIEKPTIEQARTYLKMENLSPTFLPSDHLSFKGAKRQSASRSTLTANLYLAHCGIYAFAPILFHYIEQAAQEAKQNKTEIELARAQSLMLQDKPEDYYLYCIQGKSYDTGTPKMYAVAFHEFMKG